MDADLRAVAESGSFDAVIVATHDDRLPLTVEWAQSYGILVLGCATSVEEPDPRIQRIVDEVSCRAGLLTMLDAAGFPMAVSTNSEQVNSYLTSILVLKIAPPKTLSSSQSFLEALL